MTDLVYTKEWDETTIVWVKEAEGLKDFAGRQVFMNEVIILYCMWSVVLS